MSKKAVVLAGGLPQIRLIRELGSRGYETILVDYTEHPIAEEYADSFVRESTLDIEVVRSLAAREGANLVVTCCTDQALNTVALVSEDLGLPCYVDAETGLAVTNKVQMKRKFTLGGVPTAPYAVVNRSAGASEIPFPCIVKPADCNSSKGVSRVSDERGRQVAIGRALSLSRTGEAIVEGFVEGPELSVDAFVIGGEAQVLCISRSDKIPDESSFVIQRSVYERAVHERMLPVVQPIVQKIATTFGLSDCPMLVQMIDGGDGLYVLEFSARTGGCTKYRMIEFACGVDVIRGMLDVTLGAAPEVDPHAGDNVVVDEFLYCREGTFFSLEGFEGCVADGLVEEFHALHASGTEMGGPRSSSDRVAAMTIVAGSTAEYEWKHAEISHRIAVLDPFGNDILRHDLYDGMYLGDCCSERSGHPIPVVAEGLA